MLSSMVAHGQDNYQRTVPKSSPKVHIPNLVRDKTFLELYDEYLDYCNEIVNDTVIQTGKVDNKLVPVKDKKGDVLYYKRVSKKDTTWMSYDCQDYKYEAGTLYFNRGLVWHDTLVWKYSSDYLSSDVEEVTRERICKIKRERPTPNGFFEWINNFYCE